MTATALPVMAAVIANVTVVANRVTGVNTLK